LGTHQDLPGGLLLLGRHFAVVGVTQRVRATSVSVNGSIRRRRRAQFTGGCQDARQEGLRHTQRFKNTTHHIHSPLSHHHPPPTHHPPTAHPTIRSGDLSHLLQPSSTPHPPTPPPLTPSRKSLTLSACACATAWATRTRACGWACGCAWAPACSPPASSSACATGSGCGTARRARTRSACRGPRLAQA
jgi:hypothetical protein